MWMDKKIINSFSRAYHMLYEKEKKLCANRRIESKEQNNFFVIRHANEDE